MLAKFLKRKESRHVIQQPQLQEVPEKSAEKNGIQNQQITTQPLVQYRYQRPDLLGKVKQFTYIFPITSRIKFGTELVFFIIDSVF